MLSRVAESLYWMSRNVERAETLARILDVNYNRTVDRNAAGRERATRVWRSVLRYRRHPADVEDARRRVARIGRVRALYVLDRVPHLDRVVHPDRTRQRVERAGRTLDRGVGMPSTDCTCSLKRSRRGRSRARVRRRFCATCAIRPRRSAASSTPRSSHDDEWNFLQIGRYLERSAMTARILRNHDFSDESAHEWQRLLEMCCASEPFCEGPAAVVRSERGAMAFLFLHRSFPRSIRFCTARSRSRAASDLGNGDGRLRNEAERVTGGCKRCSTSCKSAKFSTKARPRFARAHRSAPDAIGAAVRNGVLPARPVS